MTNVKSVFTRSLRFANHVRIIVDQYINGGLYIGLCTTDGELYDDITKYVVPVPHPFAYVQSGSEAEKFIAEQNLGKPTNSVLRSGFNTYRMYKFNV